jgi:uncharacterized protein YvpB
MTAQAYVHRKMHTLFKVMGVGGSARVTLATILSLAAVIGMSAPAAASAGGPAGAAPVRPSMLGAAASAVSGGVVLDGNGVLHPFGAASVAAGSAPQWPGWNIARAVALLPDGTGGWTLDGFGGVHNWGSAPSIDAPTYSSDPGARASAYWLNWDIARALVILPDHVSGYELDGYGGMHPFGPEATDFGQPVYWSGWDIARGLDISVNGAGVATGGVILDGYGGLHTFGAYPTNLTNPYHSGRDAYRAIHASGGIVYTVARYGLVTGVSGGGTATVDPDWRGYTDFGDTELLRDIVLTGTGTTVTQQPVSTMAKWAWSNLLQSQRGGVSLDGYGDLAPFGGLALNRVDAPTWQGWDIARDVVVLPDGSGGWTLDGFGGVHSWGAAPPISAPTYSADPRARAPAYWPGWDIARALVVLPDKVSGYELDGYGGLHNFGAAPPLQTPAYWGGWDIARGLYISLDPAGTPVGGIVVDGYGGLHNFGADVPTITRAPYSPGRDLAMKLAVTPNGNAYEVLRWGVTADLSGGNLRPYWDGYADAGSRDIVREVTFVGGDDMPQQQGQPVSGGARSAYRAVAWTNQIPVGTVRQSMPLDCEAAALQEALSAVGVNISQEQIVAAQNPDTRAAQVSNGTIVRWGDAYTNFVGDVRGSEARYTGYGVYAPVVAQLTEQYGRTATVVEGGSVNDVFAAVGRGEPVVVWTSNTFQAVGMSAWSAWDGRSVPYALTEHAVTVIGVDYAAQTITLNDVGVGRDKTFTVSQFASFWSSFGNMAVVIG